MPHEVYQNPPLAMVVAEVRFTYSPDLDSPTARVSALGELRKRLPALQPKTTTIIEAASPDAPANQRSFEVLEARSTDEQTTVAIGAEMVAVAMSGQAYTKFETSLRPLLEEVLRGITATAPELLVVRAGLRYLDEIKVPNPPDDVSDWGEWIDPEFLRGSNLVAGIGGHANAMRSVYQFEMSEGYQVMASWGTFFGTGVVDPTHPFFNREAHPQHMFVLDIDSSWTPGAARMASLQPDAMLTIYDRLHIPTYEIFEAIQTDAARDLFRGVR